jgi:hypothetical protein
VLNSIYVIQIFVALACWTLFQFAINASLKNRSTSHRDRNFSRLASLVSFIIGAQGLGIFLNGALDASSPRIRTLLITQASYSKKNKHWLVTAEGVVDDKDFGSHSFTIAPTTSVKRGYFIRLQTSNGAFGFEWRQTPVVYKGDSQ